jgi:hypothetical protein
MNSNPYDDDPLERINRLLDPVQENSVEESIGASSLRGFARETA